MHWSITIKLFMFFRVQKSSCLINGHCFAEGNPNPKDWCELCNSSASQDLWSKRVGE